ncbi:MAG: hypothetical protein NZ989_05175, partial [Bacteroidia bacterium]|nr:hypothetical protein [Bacteroidia bacterium]
MRIPIRLILLAGVVWAQSRQPWSAWGIYLDSTGTGQYPLSGQFTCSSRVWIVVDTAGMGARGITSWRIRPEATPFFSGVIVYDDQDPTINPNNPIPFPWDGLLNRRKIGLDMFSSPFDPTFSLTVYFTNGDSATLAKRFRNRRPSVGLIMPSFHSYALYCPGQSVQFLLDVPPEVDSFIVQYGPNSTDTVRNRSYFTLTVPNSHPWNIQILSYVCGTSQAASYQFSTDGSSFSPPFFLYPSISPQYLCIGDSVFIYPDYGAVEGFFTDSVVIMDENNAVVGGVRLNGSPQYWTPPSVGEYRLLYLIRYSCSSWLRDADTIPVRVLNATSALPQVYVYSTWFNAGACPGTPVELHATGLGSISWDLNYDGIWDTMGTRIVATFTGPPPYPIRIRQDLGCVSRIDTVNWTPPGSGDPEPAFSFSISPSPYCPGQLLSLRIHPFSNFSLSQSGSQIHITAPWLNGGQPFRLWSRLDTTLSAPSSPGSYSIKIKLENGCGAADSSIYSLLVPGPGPSSFFYVFGGTCRGSSGSVKVTTRPNSGEAPYSLRYILPDGTVITPNSPTDTVTITYPIGAFSYFTAEKTYNCIRRVEVVGLPTIEGNPDVEYFWLGSGQACAGTLIPFMVRGKEGQTVKIFVGSTLVYERGAPYSVSSWWGPFGQDQFELTDQFRVPQGNGPLPVLCVVEGCGGARDTLREMLIVDPLPQLSNLS